MSDWRHRAACRDEDPELFYAIGETGPALLQIEDAKAVCRRCPLDTREACLAFALDHNLDHGVWGMTSEAERRAMKRRAARERARAADAEDGGRSVPGPKGRPPTPQDSKGRFLPAGER